jgi:hypothetical protein
MDRQHERREEQHMERMAQIEALDTQLRGAQRWVDGCLARAHTTTSKRAWEASFSLSLEAFRMDGAKMSPSLLWTSFPRREADALGELELLRGQIERYRRDALEARLVSETLRDNEDRLRAELRLANERTAMAIRVWAVRYGHPPRATQGCLCSTCVKRCL